MPVLVLLMGLVWTGLADAATYYRDTVACTGDYSIVNRSCTGSDGNSYTSNATVIALLVPGDIVYARAGTYDDRVAFNGPDGTSSNPITFAGYPGETVVFRPNAVSTSYGGFIGSGSSFITWRNFTIDGSLHADNELGIRFEGTHDIVLEDIEFYQWKASPLISGGSNYTLRRVWSHGHTSDCSPGKRRYGLYLSASNVLIEYSTFGDNNGGGIQLYPGPASDVTIRYNRIHDNTSCATSNVGGLLIWAHTGNITNTQVYRNLIYGNGAVPPGGWGDGVQVRKTGSFVNNGTRIENNTIYNNQDGTDTGHAYCINIGTGVTNATRINNICFGNESGSFFTGSGATITQSHNACPTAHSCGPSQVNLSTLTDCLISTSDFRLKPSTNPCRNTGTSVTTSPSPIGVTDIGAYEQPEVSTVSIDSATMDITFSTGGQRLSPTSGMTGMTPGCSGHASCGTPVALSANLKAGSDVTVQLAISGIGGTGNCALTQTWVLSGASMNFGAGWIGYDSSSVQAVNNFSNEAVTEICTGSGGTPPTGEYAYYKFNSANGADSSGNGRTATVSAGVTFTTGFEGTGASIPTDAAFNHIEVTGFGTGRNPSTHSLSKCVMVTPDTSHAQKIVFSSGGNGSSQRWYAGWATVGGQKQWGIGIQGSGFTTGSEFPVSAQPTLVCLRSNAATDTAYLSVDGVTGALVGKSVKTYTSYTLVDDLRTGNDGTFSINNGGFTVDEDRTWDSFISDADVTDLYASLFPSGPSDTGYAQATHQWQAVYLLPAGSPETRGTDGQAINVVEGGAVALVFQINCTGAPCTASTLKFHYSVDGTNFLLRIPDVMGADGIAMWGSDVNSQLNSGAAECCLTGALTQNDGITVLTAVSNPTIELAEDHSYTVRLIVRVGAIAGQSRWVKAYLDNGEALGGGYTPSDGARLDVVSAYASGAY